MAVQDQDDRSLLDKASHALEAGNGGLVHGNNRNSTLPKTSKQMTQRRGRASRQEFCAPIVGIPGEGLRRNTWIVQVANNSRRNPQRGVNGWHEPIRGRISCAPESCTSVLKRHESSRWITDVFWGATEESSDPNLNVLQEIRISITLSAPPIG